VTLKTAARKAYKSTDVATLNSLLDERRKWKRRYTIATNKLTDIEAEIIALAEKLAKEKVGIKDEIE
jgi:hypothetical protein